MIIPNEQATRIKDRYCPIMLVCVGHYASRNDRCKRCTQDIYNRRCPDYKSMRVWILEERE